METSEAYAGANLMGHAWDKYKSQLYDMVKRVIEKATGDLF